MHTCKHASMDVTRRLPPCVRVRLHAYLRTHLRTYIYCTLTPYTYLRAYIGAYARIYMRAYMQTYIHTRTHAFTHAHRVRAREHYPISTMARATIRKFGMPDTCKSFKSFGWSVCLSVNNRKQLTGRWTDRQADTKTDRQTKREREREKGRERKLQMPDTSVQVAIRCEHPVSLGNTLLLGNTPGTSVS